jgi:hypothetical protein
MSTSRHVVIIGAGPYGLSIAAHMRERGIEFRIFGSPLRAWRSQMPKDKFLKSERFASNLYDPHAEFTLERFCKETTLPMGITTTRCRSIPLPPTASRFSGVSWRTSKANSSSR